MHVIVRPIGGGLGACFPKKLSSVRISEIISDALYAF